MLAVVAAIGACGGRAVDDRQSGSNAAAGSGGRSLGEAGSGGGESQDLLQQLPSRFLDEVCLYYTQCQHVRFRDAEQCREELDPYGVDALLAALAAVHIALDPDLLRQCLNDFEQRPCDPPRTAVTLQNDQLDIYQFLLACPGVLRGLMGEDEPCLADAECGPRLHCELSGCPGKCRPYYQLGEPCTFEDEQCALPYAGICLHGTCRVPLGAGAPCGDDLDCLRDLTCDPNQHVCVEPPAHPGLMGQCIRDFSGGKPAITCQSGLYCDDDGHIGQLGLCKPLSVAGEACDYEGCVPGTHCAAIGDGPLICHPDQAALGEPCEPFLNSCQGDLICPSNGAMRASGVCQVGPSLGEPCNSQCAAGLRCTANVCVSAAYPGDSCATPGTVCENSRCVDGTCRRYGRVGESCQRSDECMTLACQHGVCQDRTTCIQ